MDGRPRLAVDWIFHRRKIKWGRAPTSAGPISTFVALLVVTQQRHHVVFLQLIASL